MIRDSIAQQMKLSKDFFSKYNEQLQAASKKRNIVFIYSWDCLDQLKGSISSDGKILVWLLFTIAF